MKNKIRLISGLLAITMIGTSFVGCSKSNYTNSDDYFNSLNDGYSDEMDDTKEKDDNNKKAAVIVHDDNVLALTHDYKYTNYLYGSTYVKYDKDKFYGDFNLIKYDTIDDLETKIKAIAGEDCVITYQDNYVKSSANNTAAIVINDDNALIFLEDYTYTNYLYGSTYLSYHKDKFYQGFDLIRYKDKEELESKVKVLAGPDCNIIYQEDYAKTMKWK